MTKIAILGKGTAGALSVSHFRKYMPDAEIDWYYDPDKPTQAVGEGSVVQFPSDLFNTMNFTYSDLKKIDGTMKTGIEKRNWGQKYQIFDDTFNPPFIAYHFNALKLQSYIFDFYKESVNQIEKNVSNKNVDADYIIDCSGKPNLDTDTSFERSKYIPVNSVHVTQCYWDKPDFQHTKAIAMKYGWVFAIPLMNRCSIGYLYNKDINTLDDIKEDAQSIFKDLNLNPSKDHNTFDFSNYYRKQNYVGNVAYNGNASFFLEPLQAQSIAMINMTVRYAYDIINGNGGTDKFNKMYEFDVAASENIIMMHYFAGSRFKTPFWEYAEERGVRCMERAAKDPKFIQAFKDASKFESLIDVTDNKSNLGSYIFWGPLFFYQNVKGLDIEDKFEALLKSL
jgi:hypothetical protein